MSRYIDAEAYEKDMHDFQTSLNEWYAEAEDEDIKHRAESAIITLVEAKLRLKKQPTVDAVPVVHGHWIKADLDHDYVTCSNCKELNRDDRLAFIPDYAKGMHYCMNCGAKMDLLDDDTKVEVTGNGVKVTKYNCTKEEIEEVKAIMGEKVTE